MGSTGNIPRNGDFQNLCELTARKFGINKQFQAIRICGKANQILKNMFPECAGNIKATSYKNETLTIVASNSILLQKAYINSHQLLEQLKPLSKGLNIKRIKTKISFS